MEEEDEESFTHASPFVSRASFIPTSSISPSLRRRRLSSSFSEPNRPIPSARRLSWVNLQGKLVNAEEASSSKAIGGFLSKEEDLAWDLFSPIHRILIVAVVAVATADSKKSRQIWKLQRSRDEELLSMQQKCGCRLCDHHQRDYSVENNTSSEDEMFKFKPLMIKSEQEERRMSDLSDLASSVTSSADIQLNTLAIEQDNYNLRRACEEKDAALKEKDATIKELSALVKATNTAGSKRDSVEIGSSEDEMLKFKSFMIGAEQEERRMSDFSDLASSVASAADIQLNTLAIEQDVYNFLRECEEKDAIIKEKDAITKEKDAILEEKDATIKELSAVLKATDAAGSQRITELEELVRRKNMSITKLKKDRTVLEQQVVHLTRLRRPSTASTLTIKPMMVDNLLYDMSSTTSPSSSDSDSPIENQTRVSVNQELEKTPTPQDVAATRILQTPSAKPPMSLPKSTNRPPRSRPASPLTENSMNQRLDSPSEDPIRNRRRIHSGSKDPAQSKRRWA